MILTTFGYSPRKYAFRSCRLLLAGNALIDDAEDFLFQPVTVMIFSAVEAAIARSSNSGVVRPAFHAAR